MTEKTFGETLRELLKRHKISQRKLAQWSGLNYVTINRFLADIQIPEQQSVENIAFAYRFSDDEIISLFRSARCVPSRLIAKFADDEEFARWCWDKSCLWRKPNMTTRSPRLYA